MTCTVEPRFNQRLYNEVNGMTNDILRPSNRSEVYEKEPDITEPRYSEHIYMASHLASRFFSLQAFLYSVLPRCLVKQ